MQLTELRLSGCYLLMPRVVNDLRGRFVKPITHSILRSAGLRSDFAEQYYSTSVRGVLRGMHFQYPPHDHAKLVYCAEGGVTDVLLDLRSSSPTYGQCQAMDLSGENGLTLYITRGVAHGFIATRGPALMVYNVTSEYSPEHDTGIRWDSFGFDWKHHLAASAGSQTPDQDLVQTSCAETLEPILSTRDRALPALREFVTPF